MQICRILQRLQNLSNLSRRSRICHPCHLGRPLNEFMYPHPPIPRVLDHQKHHIQPAKAWRAPPKEMKSLLLVHLAVRNLRPTKNKLLFPLPIYLNTKNRLTAPKQVRLFPASSAGSNRWPPSWLPYRVSAWSPTIIYQMPPKQKQKLPRLYPASSISIISHRPNRGVLRLRPRPAFRA